MTVTSAARTARALTVALLSSGALLSCAGLAFAAPAVPARDPGPALVHVAGLYRLTAPGQSTPWSRAPADEDLAFTLTPGERVEVAAGGRCRIEGHTLVRASAFGTAHCP